MDSEKMTISKNGLQLTLCAHWDRDKGLDKYLLSLTNSDKQIEVWTCTSSHRLGQQKGDQHKRGGILPPVHHCRDLDKYEVDLSPVDLTHHAGVRGNFFKILPYEVTTVAGKKRGDFGIHFDGNAPGSLGCIVMDWHNWKDFEQVMFRLNRIEGLKRIPLYVYIT